MRATSQSVGCDIATHPRSEQLRYTRDTQACELGPSKELSLPRSYVVAMLISMLSMPLAVSAQDRREHLTPEALVSLTPSPNIKPTLDDAGQYVGGGIGVLVYDGVNVLDVTGPLQTFSSAGLQPIAISARTGANANRAKRLIATDCAPDAREACETALRSNWAMTPADCEGCGRLRVEAMVVNAVVAGLSTVLGSEYL